MKRNCVCVTSFAVTITCILSFLLIFSRLFAKEVLVDALDIRNEKVSLIADYTWGDQLSKHPEKHDSPGYSDEYKMIRNVYDAAIKRDLVTEEDGIVEDNSKPATFIRKYESIVNEFKADINNYCNHHFILRPYLTDIKLACSRMLKWNMAFARNDGDEYMLHNGVVDKAVAENSSEIDADLSVKEAADKYGVNYIYLQYPYRVNSSDIYVPFGAANYSNENADKYLQSMRNSGANVLDMREELEKIGWDNHEGYYLTDSHWKTYSGFEAAGIIGKYLADNYDGFVYHPEYHDESSYLIKSVNSNNPMIREKVDLYLPEFDTKLRYICLEDDKSNDVELEGEFEDTFFDMTKAEEGRFSNVLSAYSASNVGTSLLTVFQNEMDYDHYGTVLYISNSFSWHIIPYLAFDCDKVVFLHIDAKESAAGIMEQIRPDVVIEAPF